MMMMMMKSGRVQGLFVFVFERGSVLEKGCVSGYWLVRLMMMVSRILRLASGGRCMDGWFGLCPAHS